MLHSLTSCLVVPAATQVTSEPLPFLILGLWILLLALFVGNEVITKVPPTLHTPLMSGANAISGITLVGAIYCSGADYPLLGKLFGLLAIAMATTNVVGGFLVTDRMLAMFGSRKKKPKDGESAGSGKDAS